MIWSKGTSRQANSPIAEPQGEERGRHPAGHGDLDAAEIVFGQRLARDDDRPVAGAHARPVREQDVPVLDERVRVERDRRHLEPALERPLVQRLDVLQDVLELEAARIDLARGERPEHECVVGIRAVAEPDLHRSASPEEPALERAEQLLAGERQDVLRPPVVLGDACVVVEDPVRVLEHVRELVTLEDVVVAAGARRSAGAAGSPRGRRPTRRRSCARSRPRSAPRRPPRRTRAIPARQIARRSRACAWEPGYNRLRWPGSPHSFGTRSRFSSRAPATRTGSPPT